MDLKVSVKVLVQASGPLQIECPEHFRKEQLRLLPGNVPTRTHTRPDPKGVEAPEIIIRVARIVLGMIRREPALWAELGRVTVVTGIPRGCEVAYLTHDL